ncbi:p-loop containing nucleoside triphosphate hydrolase [Babesia gibsoni]|uniref:P-loop containing nucleoside triphosphate hydrolase n=1 Tax=Babesia gibsoni TaxID=33632 RepID=A0AAD8PF90_BABGI|nr:p-loop containing nucleoside triphosphate hydrolase [Babesia gibsoni]
MSLKVSRIVAVHGCKGGVGKSTVAAGIALALKEQGCSVGLCDLDICGPNIASLLGVEESHVKWIQVDLDDSTIEYDEREATASEACCSNSTTCCKEGSSCCSDPFTDVALNGGIPTTVSLLQPKVIHGIRVMSFAFIKSKTELGYAAFRGPMLDQISSELVLKTHWGQLDYLILDLPPGTSDVIISLIEEIPICGLVAVSTPHHMSVKDTVRGIRFFEDNQIKLVCLVENMSYFICDGCDKLHYLFGQSLSETMTELFGIEEAVRLPMMKFQGHFADYLMSNADILEKFNNIANIIMNSQITALSSANTNNRYSILIYNNI